MTSQEIEKVLKDCESLLVGYSITGEGPEQAGERITVLGNIRHLLNQLDGGTRGCVIPVS